MKKNRININLSTTSSAPIERMGNLLKTHKHDWPIIDLSQAVPIAPPPKTLLNAVKSAATKSENYRYGSILGKLELRNAIATQWNKIYSSRIRREEIGITSGCNQAFCAAISSIANPGDSIVLPSPWYFNHKMWLDILGIKVIPLPCDGKYRPCLLKLKKIFNKSIKAVVLVTPNNPTGQEYPKSLIKKIANFVQKKNISLIIDETYRDFISKKTSLHNLFQGNKWQKWLIHIYSFSKSYRIPGHRIGAIITGENRLKHIEKFLDTLTICPSQIGQEAALFGVCHLSTFVEKQRLELIERKKTLIKTMKKLPNWKILSIGAYFAYIKYPIALPSLHFSEILLKEVSVLVMPGSFFEQTVKQKGQDRHIRIAFANVNKTELVELVNRLASFEILFYEKYCFPQKTSLEG